MKFFLILIFIISSSFGIMAKDVDNSQMLLHVKDYILKNYSLKKPTKEFNIYTNVTNIDDSYMFIEATPTYENGDFVENKYIEDIAFVLCLEKKDSKWQIIYDLSRTDVPSNEEMKEMKKDFPSNFPKKLLSKFWQEKFR